MGRVYSSRCFAFHDTTFHVASLLSLEQGTQLGCDTRLGDLASTTGLQPRRPCLPEDSKSLSAWSSIGPAVTVRRDGDGDAVLDFPTSLALTNTASRDERRSEFAKFVDSTRFAFLVVSPILIFEFYIAGRRLLCIYTSLSGIIAEEGSRGRKVGHILLGGNPGTAGLEDDGRVNCTGIKMPERRRPWNWARLASMAKIIVNSSCYLNDLSFLP